MKYFTVKLTQDQIRYLAEVLDSRYDTILKESNTVEKTRKNSGEWQFNLRLRLKLLEQS